MSNNFIAEISLFCRKDKKEQEESVKKEVVAKDNERRDGGAEGSKDKEVSRTRERSRDKTRERSKDKPKPLRGASIERERSRRSVSSSVISIVLSELQDHD